MKKLTITLLLLISAILNASAARAQAKYPPISEYLMPQDAEIVLARSAAPASISDHATIKVLTKSGFQVAQQGDNGSVCMGMRREPAHDHADGTVIALLRNLESGLRQHLTRGVVRNRSSGSAPVTEYPRVL